MAGLTEPPWVQDPISIFIAIREERVKEGGRLEEGEEHIVIGDSGFVTHKDDLWR